MPINNASLSPSPAKSWLPWHQRFWIVLWLNSLLETCSLSYGTTSEASAALLALTQTGTCRAAIHSTPDSFLLWCLLLIAIGTTLMLQVAGRAWMNTASDPVVGLAEVVAMLEDFEVCPQLLPRSDVRLAFAAAVACTPGTCAVGLASICSKRHASLACVPPEGTDNFALKSTGRQCWFAMRDRCQQPSCCVLCMGSAPQTTEAVLAAAVQMLCPLETATRTTCAGRSSVICW